MQLTDTHCHIHEADQPQLGTSETQARWARAATTDPDHMLAEARQAGVTRVICVGTTLADSAHAAKFAATRDGVWASVGIHPHEAQQFTDDLKALAEFAKLPTKPKVVAIGECGLDYYYEYSSKAAQIACLHFQLALAQQHKLPVIFHVRDAFPDFWPIFDQYPGLRGTIHSFTATTVELEQALSRGLYISLNGIMTFTKQVTQLEAAKAVPLDRLLLETDSPFLTPNPMRDTINTPKNVRNITLFLAELRNESVETLADATTKNAQLLFGL